MNATNPATNNAFKARKTIQTPLGERAIYQLDALRGIGEVASLPKSSSRIASLLALYSTMTASRS